MQFNIVQSIEYYDAKFKVFKKVINMREFPCGPVVPLQGTKIPYAGYGQKNLYLPYIPVL